MVSSHSVTIPQLLCLTTALTFVLLVVYAPIRTQAVPLIPGGRDVEYKRYCSNTLSEAIRLICGGRYNSLGRKFPDSVGPGSFRPSALKRFQVDDGIYFRPTPSGPIHECCRRPCGYSELKMYCAPD